MPYATGGNVTTITENGILYRVHTFTTSGNLTFTTGGGTVQYLIVAGGGGGGGHFGGGGGAGGMLTGTISVATPTTYTITVGGGGTGGPPYSSTSPGGNGINSSFSLVGTTAIGGGGGGTRQLSNNAWVGRNGGSGGGAGNEGGTGPAGSGTAGQGNNGGIGFNNAGNSAGGGGGGAGSVGGAAANLTGGTAGSGLASTISGTSVTYARGGSGASGTVRGVTGGGANTGGGGAGGQSGGGGGDAGSSGIVIVRYDIGVFNRGGAGGPYGGGGGGAAGYLITSINPIITNPTYDATVSSSTNFTVSGDTYTSTGQFCSILFKVNQTSGKVYLEVTIAVPSGDGGYGMYYGVQRPPTRTGNYHDGLTTNGNGGQGVSFAVTSGGVYGMLIDIDAQTVTWNNGTPVAIPGTGQLYFGLYDGSSAATGSVTVNWGATSFVNSLPSGAVPFGQTGTSTSISSSVGGAGALGSALNTGTPGTNGGGGGGGTSTTVPSGGGGGIDIFGVGTSGAGGEPNQGGGGGSASSVLGFSATGGQPGFNGNGGLYGGGGAGGVSSEVDYTRGWGGDGAFIIIIGNVSYPTITSATINSTGALLSENTSNISFTTSGKVAVDPDGQFKSNTVQVLDQPRVDPVFNILSQIDNNVVTNSLYTPNITEISTNANVSTRYDENEIPISSTRISRSPVNNQILSSNPVLIVARQPEFMLINSNPENLVANANLAYKYDTITPVTETNDPRLATLKVPYVVKGETGVGPDDPQAVFS